MWRSQPQISRTPAGNILDLCCHSLPPTGAQPAKMLRLFSVLKCPTTTTSTFFCHERNYLQPTIDYGRLHKKLYVSDRITIRITMRIMK